MWGTLRWEELETGTMTLVGTKHQIEVLVEPFHATGMWTYVVRNNGFEEVVGACEGRSDAMREAKQAYKETLKEKKKCYSE